MSGSAHDPAVAEREYYDLVRDPWQLDNRYGSLAPGRVSALVTSAHQPPGLPRRDLSAVAGRALAADNTAENQGRVAQKHQAHDRHEDHH